jgi:mono/diheme cytochrome c family protein
MWWVMPYFETANFTDEDLDSIVLYLRSLPPVENMLPPRPPYTARALPYLPISGDLVPKATLPSSSSDVSRARAVRGRYLASVGCMTCHTPFGSGDYRRDPTRLFAGNLHFSVIPPYHTKEVDSKNLTPHENGTAAIPTPTLAATIKRTATALCGPMGLLVGAFYSGLTDDDAQSIATYLKNIPPIDTGVIPTCTP